MDIYIKKSEVVSIAMEKKLKQIMSVILAIVLMVSSIPMSFADSQDTSAAVYDKERLELPGNNSTIYYAEKSADSIFVSGQDEYQNKMFFRISLSDHSAEVMNFPDIEGFYIIGGSSEELYPIIQIDETGQSILSIWSNIQMNDRLILDLPDPYNNNILTSFLVLPDHLILTLADEIISLRRDGSFEMSLGKYQSCCASIVLSDGRLLIAREVFADSIKGELRTEIDIYDSALRLQQVFRSDKTYDAISQGPADDTLIAFKGTIAYSFNYSKDIEIAMIDTASSGMNSRKLFLMSSGQILSFERGIPFLWEKSDHEAVTELTLATYGLSDTVRQLVSSFNESSADCKVVIKDYSDNEEAKGSGSGLTKLQTDIIAGFTPDLFDLSNLNVRDFVSRGLLEDLERCIPDSLSLLTPSTVKALRKEGKVYEIMPSYSLMTVIGNRELLNADGTFSSFNFFNAAEGKTGLAVFGPEITRSDLLRTVLIFQESDYIDWDKGSCDFVDSDFQKWLSLAKSLPETVDRSQIASQDISRAMAGDQMLILYNTMGDQIALFGCYDAALGGSAAFLGFPCEACSRSAFIPSALIGISSSSAEKEKAADFLRFVLSDYSQTGRMVSGMPVLQSASDAKIEYWASDYNQHPKSLYTYYDSASVKIDAILPAMEAKKQLIDLINSSSIVATFDSNLLSLILTECQPYFHGAITEEQAVENIQSKISIYLSEKQK